MGCHLEYLEQWLPMLRNGHTPPTAAAEVAIRERLQALEAADAPFERLLLPRVYTDGVAGLRLDWKRDGGSLVLCADAAGQCQAWRIDAGAEPAAVDTVAPALPALLDALLWLASSETMLIAPARKVHPMTADAPASTGELPLVSVVVACYGALELTKNLVASLEQRAGCAYELILVDDGCPEETWKWAAAQGITCIRHQPNQGLPRTINDGAAAATGGILALWNSDMLVQPHGLRRLAEAAMVHGIAAQSGGWFRPGGSYGGQTCETWRADYPEGYCLTVRRDVWEAVGPWDEAYHPTNCDDSDWALRARLAGYHFVLIPDAVIHFGGQSTSGLAPGYVQRNQELLRQRYAPLGLGDRTLVRRWGAHGDLTMCTPALRALKAERPLSHIHVQCHDYAGKVLLGLPYVDGVFTAVPAGVHYTRAVNLNGVYELQQQNGVYEHPVQAFLRVADAPFDGQPYDFHVSTELRTWARELLPPGRFVACGLRSANRPKQNWRAAKWLELAGALPEGVQLVALDHERRPAFGPWGASAEDARFYDHPRVLDLTGQTPSLMHAAALLAACDAFVGVDSGLLHVAHSQGRPVVNLCAAAPEAARTPLVGLKLAFEGRGECFPCQYPEKCPFDRHCLDWVEPRAVAAWLLETFNAAEIAVRAPAPLPGERAGLPVQRSRAERLADRG